MNEPREKGSNAVKELKAKLVDPQKKIMKKAILPLNDAHIADKNGTISPEIVYILHKIKFSIYTISLANIATNH